MNQIQCKIIFFLISIIEIYCDNKNSTFNQTIINTRVNSVGYYGGYYNYKKSAPYYIHGKLQDPQKEYYIKRKFYLQNGSNSLEYYLRYGLDQIEQFHDGSRNVTYKNFTHFYNMEESNNNNNNTVLNGVIIESNNENNTRKILAGEKWIVSSDFFIHCPQSTHHLCPENTETVCFTNRSIFCISTISIVNSCRDRGNERSLFCIIISIPCVQDCYGQNVEEIVLPCISFITVVDVYEFKGKTISRIGKNGFGLVPARTEEERTFCVGVVFDPEDAA